jgi:hypothetical protein
MQLAESNPLLLKCNWFFLSFLNVYVGWKPTVALKYVGFICFAFQDLQLDLHNKMRVILAKLWWNICKNWIYPDIVMDWIFRSSQFCSLLSVEYILIFEDVVQSLSNMCLYDVCSLIFSDHIPIKYRGPIKKMSYLRLIYICFLTCLWLIQSNWISFRVNVS